MEPETTQEVKIEDKKEVLSTPVSIIIAGIFIALAIYMTSGKSPSPKVVTNVSVPKFSACLESAKYMSRIDADIVNAQATGGQGTPWSIVIGPNGRKYPINGAEPYGNVKTLIDNVLAGTMNVDSKDTALDKINPVTDKDHIRGSLNSKVIIVEYSDTECPFCKRFHDTMKQVMDVYGKDGRVAWVYRHYPLDGLHSRARKEALALECAFEQGGNDKFWEYTDYIYKITNSGNTLDPSKLLDIASFVGLK